MQTFSIQTVNKQIVHDFAFHLIQAIEYNNWFQNEAVYKYILSEDVNGHQDCVPIGSLEFVFEYLEKYHRISKESIHPINIPLELQRRDFLKREVYTAKKCDIPSPSYLFVKSSTRYKQFTDAITDTTGLPEDEYFVSEILDIDSEWRGFIQSGELVGLQHYLGDFTSFPNIEVVQEMIRVYKDAPNSYTLDVGISNGRTIIIEVHPLVSCGLYGFHDYKRIPSMMIQGFDHIKRVSENKGF